MDYILIISVVGLDPWGAGRDMGRINYTNPGETQGKLILLRMVIFLHMGKY